MAKESRLEKGVEELSTSNIRSLLPKDSRKYHNKYVAFASFNDNTIVAYGKNPARVIKKAERKGFERPVIVFIRDPKKTYIYNAA